MPPGLAIWVGDSGVIHKSDHPCMEYTLGA